MCCLCVVKKKPQMIHIGAQHGLRRGITMVCDITQFRITAKTERDCV